jgi:hypothetical protein
VKDLVRSVGNDGKEWDEMQKNGVILVESSEVHARFDSEILV